MKTLSYSNFYILATINPYYKLLHALVQYKFKYVWLISFSIGIIEYFYCEYSQAYRYGIGKFALILNPVSKLRWL